ncbi:MAG: hypothetical protein KatS3mg023_3868 [Armatimonadota bacterium]|nr:MAG: hypothetical protein KatS3mg023_3868 [Armatimonadota bacterium]
MEELFNRTWVDIEPYARWLIRYRFFVLETEEEDAIQVARIALFMAMKNHNPAIASLETYFAAILKKLLMKWVLLYRPALSIPYNAVYATTHPGHCYMNLDFPSVEELLEIEEEVHEAGQWDIRNLKQFSQAIATSNIPSAEVMDLKDCLKQIGEPDRTLLFMKYGLNGYAEMTNKEISEVTGMSIRQIQWRLSRILCQLKQMLSKGA